MNTNEAIEKFFGKTEFPAVCKCGTAIRFKAGAVMHIRKIHRLKFHNVKNLGIPIMQAKRTIIFK